jgi:hypothetical protein
MSKNQKMKTLVEWIHESVKGPHLEIVKVTDCHVTILGLKDPKSDEVFVLGNMHDLTFLLNGNDRDGRLSAQ